MRGRRKQGDGKVASPEKINDAGHSKEVILIAIFGNEAKAQRAIEKLMDKGFAMDMISVLGRVHAAGDDVLGIYHTTAGQRVEAWARQGALWGAMWGLLAGAAGLFVFPGIGPVLAAGPIVEAIIGALGGAAVGGAVMTGAAELSHLASAMHRIGVPEEMLEHLHRAIEEGRYLLLLRGARSELQEWRGILGWSDAEETLELPYTGIKDLVS
jgi:hypothetical protein